MSFAVSDAFKERVKTNHLMFVRFQVYEHGTAVDLPVPLLISEGSVSEDANNAVRRTASFTIIDPTQTLIPTDLSSIFAPGNNEIQPSRGVRVPGEGDIFVPLGIFSFDDIDINLGENGVVMQITGGFDRSQLVARAAFTETFTIASGTPVDTAIHDIIDSRFPDLTYMLSGSVFATPQLVYDAGSDPWAAVTAVAESAGLEVFFDENGGVVIRDVPDAAEDPIQWEYGAGETSVMTTASRRLSKPRFNHFIEVAEGPEIAVPFYGEAKDNIPSSPTWVGWGDYPSRNVSDKYTSVEQCVAAAEGKLRKTLGSTEGFVFSAIPNPALQSGDIISIDRPEVKIDELTYVVDRVTTPLNAEASQSVEVRQTTGAPT